MGSAVVEMLVGLLPVDLRFRSRELAAYRAAWKCRTTTGDTSADVLDAALKDGHVRGAYTHRSDGPTARILQAWNDGLTPRQARRIYGRKFERDARRQPNGASIDPGASS